MRYKIALILSILTLNLSALSQDRVPYSEPVEVPASPKRAWDELPQQRQNDDYDLWQKVFLYIPNRVLDLIDIFHVDVGAGPTYGGVLRLSEQGQMGHREVDPFSFRLGLFGRQLPVLVEKNSEYGFGSNYTSSEDRSVCPGEFGFGLDLFLGGYIGICIDEAIDFFGGVVGFDPKGDDY